VLSAKIKLKAKGAHAEQILQQLPQLGIKTAQVQVAKKPILGKKGNNNARNGNSGT